MFFFRRVHITQATLDYLGGEYEVEPGNGATRNQYLRDHCVTTYFIVPPARRRKVLVTSQNDRRGCILLHPNDRIFCGPLWNGARYRQPVWTISLINLFELVFVTRRILGDDGWSLPHEQQASAVNHLTYMYVSRINNEDEKSQLSTAVVYLMNVKSSRG